MTAKSPQIFLFWDKAHIWGLLPHHALTSLGVPFKIVRGAAIARGLLEKERPEVLIVPGGFSRQKMEALGSAGAQAIRDFAASGGAYLGFCGGAGFALTDPYGLGLCPFVRKPFSNRLQHFASGHIRAAPQRENPLTPLWMEETPLLPVWWPARFAPETPTTLAESLDNSGAVDVLAAYGAPGPDFMMADIRVGALPGKTLAAWEAKYGVSLDPTFLMGGPCIVSGRYGQGRYVLSHAHLETPGSPVANAWLGHILAVLCGETPPAAPGPAAPEWDLGALPKRFNDAIFADCSARMDEAVALGLENGLLYRRNPWLFGWRPGTPGFAVSNLYALFRQAGAIKPNQAAMDYWRAVSPHFHRMMLEFQKGLSGYFLAERLAATLSRFDPEAVPDQGLAAERRLLFGPPPGAGGLCGELLGLLDQLIWLLLTGVR
jgi:hypothetical protein